MITALSDIEKLAFGGSGIGRIDGKVCFVPFSCPGDQVRVKVTSQKKSYCTAEISEILKSSPDRTNPLCPLFGTCGGCNWQHISYPVQLTQKREIFADILWRGARVPGELIQATVASPIEYGYRSRVQFKVSVKHGALRIGFYRNASHEVVDAPDGCPVADPLINHVLKCFRSVLNGFKEVDQVEQISVDIGQQGAMAVVHCNGKTSAAIRSFLSGRAAELGQCAALYLSAGFKSGPVKVWGTDEVSYSMPTGRPDHTPLCLAYSPGGFAQVNQLQNVAILTIIRRMAGLRTADRLLDLYCGNGNFSLPLADEVTTVLGIEGSADSIRSAKANRLRNGIANAEFICSDVKIALPKLVDERREFDIVLLDPPRAGAGDIVTGIASLNPSRIVYVSCDPSTLSRDCAIFAGHGFRVVESVPLDMFPQTYHLESVTLLTK